MAAKVRRNDTVEVMSGKDRGRRGDVRSVVTSSNRLLVGGVNMVKKHRRARSANEPSQIIEIESPIHASNVRVVCRSCDQAARVGFRVLEDGRKVRYCKRCDEAID
ncbi:MAG: 50S ribosomal protein L24 [Dehalococcoidia bacterium]|nr:50S ribosomal protein L24 [Dehalococcoidia bacterium]